MLCTQNNKNSGYTTKTHKENSIKMNNKKEPTMNPPLLPHPPKKGYYKGKRRKIRRNNEYQRTFNLKKNLSMQQSINF